MRNSNQLSVFSYQFSVISFQFIKKLIHFILPSRQPTTDNRQPLSGFTLLELLVVISIIAILITIGLTSFSTAQKKGRDTKRKSDLREVQQALESYYSVCGFSYLVPTNFFSQGIICSSPSIAIMPTVPSDPRGTPPYGCATPVATNCTTSAYIICATMESETNAYCLKNQQ